MSDRDGYQHGVPCWIDTWQSDAEAAARFYTTLLGWKADGGAVPGSNRRHYMCRLRDRHVAAIGSPAPAGLQPTWGTYIWVDRLDDLAPKLTSAGGTFLLDPFDSLDGGRMAVAADPTGAVFGLWQPGAHRGAQIINEAGAWSWSQLHTTDLDAASRFYREVLGWETEPFGSAVMFRVPGYVGGVPEQPVSRDVVAGMASLSDRGKQSHWQVDFWVHDVDATVETTTRMGGAVVVPAYDSPIARQAILADPAGATFSVSKIRVPG